MSHGDAHETDALDETHDGSWSVNLETDEYAGDEDATVADAVVAVDHTRPGHHVNLVTHGENGHPETYLYADVEAAFDDVTVEFVDRCGCGGYVTRVHRE